MKEDIGKKSVKRLAQELAASWKDWLKPGANRTLIWADINLLVENVLDRERTRDRTANHDAVMSLLRIYQHITGDRKGLGLNARDIEVAIIQAYEELDERRIRAYEEGSANGLKDRLYK